MEITCLDVRRELSNYLEDDITPQLRQLIDQHIQRCKGCTAVYDGIRNVLRLMLHDRVIELPTGFSQRLYQRLHQEIGQ